MKSLLSVLTLITLSSMANAFQVSASCSFSAASGQCAVYNQWYSPMKCSLRAQGQVSSGAYVDVWENVYVYPGEYAYAYVNANNPYYDPLIAVAGSANCQF
jgi:hypothetical protein